MRCYVWAPDPARAGTGAVHRSQQIRTATVISRSSTTGPGVFSDALRSTPPRDSSDSYQSSGGVRGDNKEIARFVRSPRWDK